MKIQSQRKIKRMNTGNSSLKEIGAALLQAETVMIYPHVNMDGDAFGSAIALSYILLELGRRPRIFVSEEIPENLKFLDVIPKELNFSYENHATNDKTEAEKADISLLIDCGELKRIPNREEAFNSGGKTICLDHHGTTEAFCQMNYIDSDAAATGQIVFNLIMEMGLENKVRPEVLKLVGEALFAAITTDTGDFQYSNTQKESHEIVAKLYDWGIDHNKVSVEIYESVRPERIRLSAAVLSNMKILEDGKVALGCVSQQMLRETGGKMEETEWIAGDLRSIKGVEVAVFLKEEGENLVKCSLRSKSYFDVAKLAQAFGGGGHIRAAGYTVNCSLAEAEKAITKAIQESFKG